MRQLRVGAGFINLFTKIVTGSDRDGAEPTGWKTVQDLAGSGVCITVIEHRRTEHVFMLRQNTPVTLYFLHSALHHTWIKPQHVHTSLLLKYK